MLSLHTNAASLSTSMTRLRTRSRINSAMDDAAGLQIATRQNAQISGMAIAQRNTQNAISMLQTGNGALNEGTAILTRMKELAPPAAEASLTPADQPALQSEYDALGRELNNFMKSSVARLAKASVAPWVSSSSCAAAWPGPAMR